MDYLDENSEGFKSLRKANKEKDQKIADLTSRLERLEAERSKGSVAETLASSGLDPRVAKFYPQDAPTDETSVAQWVEENKDYFGSRRIVNNGNQDEDVLTDSERRGYQIIQDMAAYQDGVNVDLKSRLDKIQYDPSNPEKAQQELMATLKEFEGYLNM